MKEQKFIFVVAEYSCQETINKHIEEGWLVKTLISVHPNNGTNIRENAHLAILFEREKS